MPIIFFTLLGLAAAGALAAPVAGPIIGKPMTLHMLQDVALLFVIPLPALFAVRALGRRAPSGWRGRAVRLATHPAVTMLHFNLAVGVWHLPPVYEAAMHVRWWAGAMYLSFFLAGASFWWVIVEPLQGSARSLDPVSKIGYLVVAGVPPTVPGILLALSTSPLYVSFPAVDDQQYAGLLLFGTAKLVLLLSMGVLFARLFQSAGGEGADWGGDETPVPPGPNGIPAWLFQRRGELLSPSSPRRRSRVAAARQPSGAASPLFPRRLVGDAAQDRQRRRRQHGADGQQRGQRTSEGMALRSMVEPGHQEQPAEQRQR